MIVQTTAQPAREPFDVETLEAELVLPATDRALLLRRAKSARRAVEQWTGHRLITQTVMVAGLSVVDGVAMLPVVPVQALLSVVSPTGGDSGTVYPVTLEELVAMPDGMVTGFPPYVDRVSLSVRVGYGSDPEAVPEDFLAAISQLVGQWSEWREGVAGGLPGQSSSGPSTLPHSVADLLAHRRLIRLR